MTGYWITCVSFTISQIQSRLMNCCLLTKDDRHSVTAATVTRRMAIANGRCVSFCNQPKAHYLATSRESHRYVVAYSRFAGAACRHLATSRESKAHFGLPWVRPWDYHSKCYMDGKRSQCLSNASQHVPIN